MNILRQTKPVFDEYKNTNNDQYKELRKTSNFMPDLSAMIGEKKAEEEVKETSGERVNIQRLNTPTLRMALAYDSSQALKDEINESYMRVKAAKHGVRLTDIVPEHDINFYLPNKLNYVKPKEYQKVKQREQISSKHSSRHENSNTFLTSLNRSQVPQRPKKLGIKSVQCEPGSQFIKPGHAPQRSAQFPKFDNPETSKNSLNKFRNTLLGNTGRTLSQRNNNSAVNSPAGHKLNTSPQAARRLNGISYRFSKDKVTSMIDQRRKIRLVSLIDSKPINHYITLLSLKEYSKREQDMGSLAGSIQASVGLKEKESQKKRDITKILREDLNQQYEEKIGRRYASMVESRRTAANAAGPDHLEIRKNDLDDESVSENKSEQSNSCRKVRKMSKMSVGAENERERLPGKNKNYEWNEKTKHLLNPDFAKIVEDKVKRQIVELYEYHNNRMQDQQEQDTGIDNKIESEEQAKRIAQLKRDQELAEFEEKGGLSRILTNLNPILRSDLENNNKFSIV